MPRFVALPASMTKIQKLSCSAGQWYLALCLSITRLVMVDCEEAILRRVEQYRGDWRFQGKAQLRRGNSSSACCSPSLSSVRAAPYGCSCNLCPLSRRSSVKPVALRECDCRRIVAGATADVERQSIRTVHVCVHVRSATQCAVSSSPAVSRSERRGDRGCKGRSRM